MSDPPLSADSAPFEAEPLLELEEWDRDGGPRPPSDHIPRGDAEPIRRREADRAGVVKGIRWGVFNQGVQQVVRLSVTVILTKKVAPENYGVLALGIVVLNLGLLLSGLGFGPALVQRKNLTKKHVDAAMTGSVAVGVLLFAIFAMSSSVVSHYFNEPKLRPVLIALGVVFLCQGVESTPNDMLRRSMHFREFVLSSTVACILGAGTGVVLALRGAQVWALVFYMLVEAFVAGFLAMLFAYRAGVWKPAFTTDRQAFKDLLGFSSWVIVARILYYVQGNADNFVVGKVLGAVALGFYGLAFSVLVSPINKILDVMGNVADPTFASLQGDRPRLRSAFLIANRYICAVIFPITIGVAVTAPQLVPVVFGSKWVPAVATMQILCLNGPRLGFGKLNGTLWQATGFPRWASMSALSQAVLMVPAFIIGVHWDVVGVAVGFTIAGWLVFPVGLYFNRRVTDASAWSQIANVVPLLMATGTMALAAWGASTAVGHVAGDVAQLAAGVATGVVAFAIGLVVFDRTLLRQAWADIRLRGGDSSSTEFALGRV